MNKIVASFEMAAKGFEPCFSQQESDILITEPLRRTNKDNKGNIMAKDPTVMSARAISGEERSVELRQRHDK